MLKLYSGLDRGTELNSLNVLTKQFMTSPLTAAQGWGAMDTSVWRQQIDMWSRLGQFHGSTPQVGDVMDDSVLNATAAQRPKLGSGG